MESRFPFPNIFRTSVENFSLGPTKLHSTCPQGLFQGTYFERKCSHEKFRKLDPKFSDFFENFSAGSRNLYSTSAEDLIEQKKKLFRIVKFSDIHSRALSRNFSVFWLSSFGRVVETAFQVSKRNFWRKLFHWRKIINIFEHWAKVVYKKAYDTSRNCLTFNQKKQQKIISRVPTQGYNYQMKHKIKNNYLSMG